MGTAVGRNDPCPCGSGKKYKRCCLGKEAPRPLATKVERRKAAPARANKPLFAPVGHKPTPETPPRPRDEWDDWLDRYRDANPVTKCAMLRVLLTEEHPPEFYKDLGFTSLVLDLPDDPGPDGNGSAIAFLEELLSSRPGLFNLGAEWFARRMAYAYVRTGREREISQVLPCLLDEAHEPDDPLFDLIDLVRLAGLYEESRSLAFAVLKQAEHASLMSWAEDELIEFAAFFLYQEAVEAGGTPEALERLRGQLAEMKCHPPEPRLTAMLAHRCGTVSQPLVLNDLLGRGEPAGFNCYLLSLDFGRWLTAHKGMPSLVADTLRHFVHVCLVEMVEKSDRNPLTLHQQRLDRYLGGLLGFLSVMHLRGVATLIAMRHFFDFAASTHVINEGEHRRARRICDDLWSQMQRALGNGAPDYAFLNRYL